MRRALATCRAALLVASLAIACEPAPLRADGHLVVYLDTDAVLPLGPGEPDQGGRPPPLFDRLSLEVLLPTGERACTGCVRDLEANEPLFKRPASFTLVRGAEQALVLHAELHRAAGEDGAEAPSAIRIETWVRLPVPADEGETPVAVFLPTNAVGRPIGTLAAPADPVPGAVRTSRVGSWPEAATVSCVAPRGAESEVCVPGGAYWMGNPRQRRADKLAADRQRLVVLSPFYLDDHEVTVGELRAALGPISLPELYRRVEPVDAAQRLDRTTLCNYTTTPGPFEDHPVNCVTFEAAVEHCAKRGMLLPSEAQFEYAASARRSSPYPWGNDEAECGDAVWGVATTSSSEVLTSDACMAWDNPERRGVAGGTVPLPPPDQRKEPALTIASRARDRVQLPGGAIFDLGGSVSEWVRDRFGRQDEPCWSRPETNVFFDPVCTEEGTLGGTQPDDHPVRGGSWSFPRAAMRAASRRVHYRVGAPSIGFRCVRVGR